MKKLIAAIAAGFALVAFAPIASAHEDYRYNSTYDEFQNVRDEDGVQGEWLDDSTLGEYDEDATLGDLEEAGPFHVPATLTGMGD